MFQEYLINNYEGEIISSGRFGINFVLKKMLVISDMRRNVVICDIVI